MASIMCLDYRDRDYRGDYRDRGITGGLDYRDSGWITVTGITVTGAKTPKLSGRQIQQDEFVPASDRYEGGICRHSSRNFGRWNGGSGRAGTRGAH